MSLPLDNILENTLDNTAGFTLFELVLCLAVVSILAASSRLLSREIFRAKLVSRAAISLEGVLNHKSLEALSGGRPVILAFDEGRGEMFQIEDASSDRQNIGELGFRFRLPTGIRFQTLRIPRLESQVPHLRYTPEGIASPGTLILEDRESPHSCSIIQSLAGSRRVQCN